MSRIISFLIMLPLLVGAWGFANSTGITDRIEEAAGVEIPQGFTIPGADKILDLSEGVRDVRNKAEERARRAALAALRDQVEQRYGPEAAAAVPEDLPLNRMKRLRPEDFASLAALGSALGAPALEALGENVPDLPGGNNGGPGKPGGGGGDGKGDGNESGQPGDVPFMNVKAYNEARKLLPTLDVKGKAPMTGYSRDEFGSEWSDSAGDSFWANNGCDTRNDMLKRDLVKVVFEKGSKCEVESGVLPYEPYSGQKDYRFVAGSTDMSVSLDGEHVVALGNSWVTGSFKWTEEKRAAFANDALNVMAASASLNRQKSDADAATWLPPNKAYRCAYISRQVAIKAKYDLWLAPAEKDAIVRVLDGCPS